MIDYPALKTVHVVCVAASYTLFAVRGVWMIRESAQAVFLYIIAVALTRNPLPGFA